MPKDLLAIVGLTCTGKGALAFAVADALGGPAAVAFVVCDSVKVYRGADIGAAKVVGAERRGYDFFMTDVADVGEIYNAGRYMAAARAACDEIWRAGKLALVVGGTGLYFRALVDGVCSAPAADAETRAALRARQAAGENLYEYLRTVDAAAATRISPADTKRVIRALEVFELTGVPLSAFHRAAAAPPLAADRLVVFALDGPRPWLAARIVARVRRMLAAGLRAEVERLLGTGVAPTAPPLNAIGYRQMVNVVTGVWDEEAAATAIARDTRRLAKRQRTWFKREARAIWLDAAEGTPALRDRILHAWQGR